jgi:hypothetical protein
MVFSSLLLANSLDPDSHRAFLPGSRSAENECRSATLLFTLINVNVVVYHYGLHLRPPSLTVSNPGTVPVPILPKYMLDKPTACR